jgi:hypothetical protein
MKTCPWCAEVPVIGLEAIAVAAFLFAGRPPATIQRTEWRRGFLIAAAPNAIILLAGAWALFYALL